MDFEQFGGGSGSNGGAASSAQANVSFGSSAAGPFGESSWLLPAVALLGSIVVFVLLIKD